MDQKAKDHSNSKSLGTPSYVRLYTDESVGSFFYACF